ncbi:MAG: hypothetical protein OHK0013_01650 [Sandaracinaceae bacterium]
MSAMARGGGPPRGQEPRQSNYAFLPQTGQAVPAPREDLRHDRLSRGRITGSLELDLVAVDPIHVGSGAPVSLDGAIARAAVMTLRDDVLVPVVPGSSIKGAVRSLCEALLGGGAPDEPNVDRTLAGSLFGYVTRDEHFQGRIAFDDALPVSDDPVTGTVRLPTPYQPRKAGRTRKIYGPPRGPQPKEVPFEVLASREVLRTNLRFVNVTESELGTVLLAMGLDGSFYLRLGGGKHAGLGRVRFEPVSAVLRRGYAAPTGERLDAASAKTFVARCLEKPVLADKAQGVIDTLRQVLGRSA